MDPHHSSWMNVLCFFHTCLRLSDLPKVMQLSSHKFRLTFFTFHTTIGIRAFICLLAEQVKATPSSEYAQRLNIYNCYYGLLVLTYQQEEALADIKALLGLVQRHPEAVLALKTLQPKYVKAQR